MEDPSKNNIFVTLIFQYKGEKKISSPYIDILQINYYHQIYEYICHAFGNKFIANICHTCLLIENQIMRKIVFKQN